METLVPIPSWFFDSMVQRGAMVTADIPQFPTADPNPNPPYFYGYDPNFALIINYGKYDLLYHSYVNTYMKQLIPATDAIEAAGNTLTI